MKKMPSILLCLLLALSTLTACGANTEPPAADVKAVAEAPATETETEAPTADAAPADEPANEEASGESSGEGGSSLEMLEEAALAGNAEAARLMGEMNQSDENPNPNYEEALKWDQIAVELGQPRAMTNLGILYLNGWGTEQDYAEALEWFEQGVEAGDEKAPRYVGIIYENGYGVDVDLEKAAASYEEGSERGDITSKQRLASMYEEGRGVEQDYGKAYELYLESSERDDHIGAPSQYAIGRMYENGWGVEQDIDTAIEWYERAAANTSEEAAGRIAELRPTKEISGDILDLDTQLAEGTYAWELSEDGVYYALRGVQYVANPTDPSPENILKQSMNIFVPAAYLNEDGTINEAETVNGYTAATAPIIYKNGVSGYAEAVPADGVVPDFVPAEMAWLFLNYMWGENQTFLENGYVVVSPGSRGKETVAADGTYIGKSPAALVDLKAGVRFVKYNDDAIPGDAGKIISIGTSAGGAMSSLLAASGNNSAFDPYLKEIGAVMEAGIGDDVFAAQAYCPITDLENADMAYEWCFGGDESYAWSGAYSTPSSGEMSQFQIALSSDLAASYVDYLNGLDLGLTLDGARSGSYYDALLAELSESLNVYLAEGNGGASDEPDYSTFAELDEATGLYTITDLDVYVNNYRSRMKMCPAFDSLYELESENQEFGSKAENTAHFSRVIAGLLTENDYSALTAEDYVYDYTNFNLDTMQAEAVSGSINLGWQDSLIGEYAQAFDEDVQERVALINVMNYLLDENAAQDNTIAEHVRIRVGSHDSDTSFSVSFNAALAFDKLTDTDYGIVWGEGHGNCNDTAGVMNWIDGIVK